MSHTIFHLLIPLFFILLPPPPKSTLFPYTTLFRSLIKAVKGLYNQDITQAKEIIKADKRLDKLDQIINDQAILLIAKQQPVATDLRRLIACIRIYSYLERMDYYAKKIAKSTT